MKTDDFIGTIVYTWIGSCSQRWSLYGRPGSAVLLVSDEDADRLCDLLRAAVRGGPATAGALPPDKLYPPIEGDES